MYSIANKKPGKLGDILIAFTGCWKGGVTETEFLGFKEQQELHLLRNRSFTGDRISSVSHPINAKRSDLTFTGNALLILPKFTTLSAEKRKPLPCLKYSKRIQFTFSAITHALYDYADKNP